MKKIILFFAAVAMSAAVASAQDINQATENYNNGAMELQMGNNGLLQGVTGEVGALSISRQLSKWVRPLVMRRLIL